MFVLIGYSIPGFVFGAAAAGYIICCAIVVPLLVLLSGRLKFWAWQFAIASLTLAVLADNVRLKSLHQSQIGAVAYTFWAIGTLLSSPLPVYFLLRSMAPQRRYVLGIVIVVIIVGLWIGIKRITG
jgi:hypothetical protein